MDDLELVARTFFDRIHARDWDGVAELYSDDAEYVRADGASRGREEIVAYLTGIMNAFPDHASAIETVLVGPDHVTVEWTETATHTEPYVGSLMGTIPPTGKSFKERIVEVFRFEDGKVVSQHEYYDLLSLLGQLGWLPAPAVAS
jgi:steroid delta-isomerase-like uncharacterized protein